MKLVKDYGVEIELKQNIDAQDHMIIDALPIPWRTQMWAQVEDSEKGRSRSMLPSSQHFEG
jgi:hypothetical protein